MRKKWLALALSLTMVAGCLTGCGGSDSSTSNTNSGSSNDSAKVETLADGGGKVLNIYVWNDEFHVSKNTIRTMTRVQNQSEM